MKYIIIKNTANKFVVRKIEHNNPKVVTSQTDMKTFRDLNKAKKYKEELENEM